MLAVAMRRHRFHNGSLRLDNVKLMFVRNKDGNPVDAQPYGELRTSELMSGFGWIIVARPIHSCMLLVGPAQYSAAHQSCLPPASAQAVVVWTPVDRASTRV